MTKERWIQLQEGDDSQKLTPQEIAAGWHWCHEFDGLLRNNREDDFQCDCLGPHKFQISEDAAGRCMTCRKCGRTSHNENDIKHRYCGHCHEFHEHQTVITQ